MNEDDIIDLASSVSGKARALLDGIGIGDDAAVIHRPDGMSTLITTDLLTDGVHFLGNQISGYDLGHKSLAVNVSDIAAMGGNPLYAFLSLAIPPQSNDDTWIRSFFAGFQETARRYNVQLLGGDTTRSLNATFISVTLIGEAKKQNIKLRSKACVGDFVAVTAPLGDSFAGLTVLLESLLRDDLSETLISRHHRPLAFVPHGAFLGSLSAVHAMMDISDGFVADINKLCNASGVGAEIIIEHLPISDELQLWCQRESRSALEMAAVGGEDYCLLLTLDQAALTDISESYLEQFGSSLHVVGRITSKTGVVFTQGGEPFELRTAGYSHF